MDFYVVCTDIESGKAVYHKFEGRDDHCFDWVRASASMPLVSQIVDIEGQKLLDGGVADSIPVKFFENLGFDKNLVILTQPKGYKKKKNPLLPLIKIKYKKFPNLVRAMANRHNVYNETLDYVEKCEKENKLFVLRPESKLPVGKIEKDPKKMMEAYQIGRKTALDNLEKIKNWISD
jgi:predicted patatin/cPLA2 family phospholipase